MSFHSNPLKHWFRGCDLPRESFRQTTRASHGFRAKHYMQDPVALQHSVSNIKKPTQDSYLLKPSFQHFSSRNRKYKSLYKLKAEDSQLKLFTANKGFQNPNENEIHPTSQLLFGNTIRQFDVHKLPRSFDFQEKSKRKLLLQFLGQQNLRDISHSKDVDKAIQEKIAGELKRFSSTSPEGS